MMTSVTFQFSAVVVVVAMLATNVVQANQYNLTFKTDYKGDEKLHIQIERPEALACQIKACPLKALEKMATEDLHAFIQPIQQYASRGNTTHGAGYLSANIAIDDSNYLLYPGNEQSNQFQFVNGRFLTQNSDKNFDGCLRVRNGAHSSSPKFIDIAYMHPRYRAQTKHTYSEDCSKFRIRIGEGQVKHMVSAIRFNSVSIVFQIQEAGRFTSGQCLHASVMHNSHKSNSLSREERSQCDMNRLAIFDFKSHNEFHELCKRSVYGMKNCGTNSKEQEFYIKLSQKQMIALLNRHCPAPSYCE